MLRLKDKVVVVTGGSSGIGLATAKEFILQGAKVIITGRNKATINNAVNVLGGNITGIVSDAASITDTIALVEQIKASFSKLDVLFINAGISYFEPIGGITEKIFDAVISINFKGAVFTIEKFLPILSDGAAIISLSSINAHTAASNTAVYAASKAALNAYTRTAAIELAQRKIRVSIINPGPIVTGLLAKAGLPEKSIQDMISYFEEKIPLHRIGQPEDIAKLAAFLASEDASFITGAEFDIDGGVSIKGAF